MKNRIKRLLSIGIFEEDQRLLPLLRKSLAQDSYIISQCPPYGRSLATFLEAINIQWQLTRSSLYDLIIIDISSTELVGKTLVALEQIVILKSIPIILLTDTPGDELKALTGGLIILPLSFRRLFPIQILFTAIEQATDTVVPLSVPVLQTIVLWQRKQYNTTLQSEQSRIDQQNQWLNQRNEWLEQRHRWLHQRDVWLSRMGHIPHPQYEWLNEQHDWVEQQHNEVNQQIQWLDHRRIWLIQRQSSLDHVKLQLPFREAQ